MEKLVQNKKWKSVYKAKQIVQITQCMLSEVKLYEYQVQ